MTLINAMNHLISKGGKMPNRMFKTRFNRGKISPERMRSILYMNNYKQVSIEGWEAPKKK